MRNESPRPGPASTDSIPGPLAAACSQIRLTGPQDRAPGGWAAVDWAAGTAPSYLAAPQSIEEAAALLRAAAGLGLAVLPRGSGTRLGWGPPPRRCDLVVDMTRMNRVLEHAAGDLVVRVQAGISLQQLAAALATAGQRLALDPPAAGPPAAGPAAADPPGTPASRAAAAGAGRVDAAPPASTGTVGGLLATGVAGPLRLRYGGPRDLLIGITVIRADGTVAKAGGKVVKNVAGYDLGKLFAGSYGTLGLIAEATFRLHPRPAAAVYVTLDCADAAEAGRVMSAAGQSRLAPSAAEIDWPAAGTPIRAAILLEGNTAGAAQRAERLRELLGELAGAAAACTGERPPWWGQGAAAAASGTVLRIAFWPGELAAVLSASRAAAAAASLDPVLSGSAAAGLLHASLPPQAEPAAVAGFVIALRAALASGQHAAVPGVPGPPGSAVVLHAPPQVRDLVDLWGPVPSLSLMRAVKDQFDPDGRMAPGRFAGGI